MLKTSNPRTRGKFGGSTNFETDKVAKTHFFEDNIREGQHGCGSNPFWYHFGVGAPPSLVYFSGDWDVKMIGGKIKLKMKSAKMNMRTKTTSQDKTGSEVNI